MCCYLKNWTSSFLTQNSSTNYQHLGRTAKPLLFFANINRKKLIQHQKDKDKCGSKYIQKSGVDFRLSSWQVSHNKQYLVWLAGYCWVCVGVEKGWTFSQDVASLPSLRGSQEESSVPFNFLFVLCLLRPHSLSLACNLCYSSCAVCATRSWKDRKTDLENYFMDVISDYRTAVPACAWYWQPRARFGSWGQGWGWIMPSHGGDSVHPLLKALLLHPCKNPCASMQPGQHSSCGETRGSSTRQPEVARNLCNFQFISFIFSS